MNKIGILILNADIVWLNNYVIWLNNRIMNTQPAWNKMGESGRFLSFYKVKTLDFVDYFRKYSKKTGKILYQWYGKAEMRQSGQKRRQTEISNWKKQKTLHQWGKLGNYVSIKSALRQSFVNDL